MKNWKKIKSEQIFGSKYFHLRMDECETLSGKIMPRYYVVDFPDWVQTIAFDERDNVILVDQYRYPGQGWFLEFPGGSSDSSRVEDPLDAAKRELKEETGYECTEWIAAGFHYPNPALLTNKCHVFVAKNCKKTSEPNLDPFEELKTKLVPKSDLEKMLLMPTEDGLKIHSLMLASYVLGRRFF